MRERTRLHSEGVAKRGVVWSSRRKKDSRGTTVPLLPWGWKQKGDYYTMASGEMKKCGNSPAGKKKERRQPKKSGEELAEENGGGGLKQGGRNRRGKSREKVGQKGERGEEGKITRRVPRSKNTSWENNPAWHDNPEALRDAMRLLFVYTYMGRSTWRVYVRRIHDERHADRLLYKPKLSTRAGLNRDLNKKGENAECDIAKACRCGGNSDTLEKENREKYNGEDDRWSGMWKGDAAPRGSR
ncbi:hypothetical protein BJ138DRAFT_1200407 [Hygrophoropsis aurantiaca]|uniref:Uncharacterized protein n=1 Tax=Hygrophoropsis aurantiaca TaxID=72124 RepID=A0ACB8A7U2_9AGAM|nr:hypothetical protein BJ138DRAFT_1200407 [Hygrophoropsis aurantiaca]